MTYEGNPLISVLITAYNRKELLSQAVDSALNQTLPRPMYEILVVKNFKCGEDIEWEKANVKIFFDESEKFGERISKVLPLCSGKLVTCLNDDDWWAPNRLSHVFGVWNRSGGFAYYKNGIVEVYSPPRHNEVAGNEWIREYPWHNDSSIMISKKVLEDSLDNLVHVNMAYDAFCYFAALSLDGKVVLDPSPLTYWRVPPPFSRNFSLKRNQRHAEDVKTIQRMLLQRRSGSALKVFPKLKGNVMGAILGAKIHEGVYSPQDLPLLFAYMKYRIMCEHYELRRWISTGATLVLPSRVRVRLRSIRSRNAINAESYPLAGQA